MKSPSVKSVRVPPRRDTFDKKCPALGGHFSGNPAEKSYGRVAAKVCADPDLSSKDVRVYAALAILERGGVVNSGVRWIAACCAMGRSAVSRSIASLIRHGHVEVSEGRKLGQRQRYSLTSQVFQRKREILPKCEQASCKRCSKVAHRVAASGLCRTCTDADSLSEKVSAARIEIGMDATASQIAAHLKNARLTKRISRLLGKVA